MTGHWLRPAFLRSTCLCEGVSPLSPTPHVAQWLPLADDSCYHWLEPTCAVVFCSLCVWSSQCPWKILIFPMCKQEKQSTETPSVSLWDAHSEQGGGCLSWVYWTSEPVFKAWHYACCGTILNSPVLTTTVTYNWHPEPRLPKADRNSHCSPKSPDALNLSFLLSGHCLAYHLLPLHQHCLLITTKNSQLRELLCYSFACKQRSKTSIN